MKFKKQILFLIVLLAGFLRFYKLGQNPPALSWDEAAWGYNGYSLGLTAKDEFGRFLPKDYLESFGDFKPPVYAYLTILPVKIFGLNEFSTRFVSAFFGALTVLLVYFLVKELFKSQKIALISLFLLAISPWHIMLSRAAFEANVAQFFIIAGVLLFLKGLRQRNWFLVISAISFALSLHTFNTARIFVPLLVLGLIVGFRKFIWENRKLVILSVFAGFIILLPALPFFLTPQAKLRFKEVNIFSDAGVVNLANQEMVNDNWSFYSRIIHNRRWGYFRSFLRHYFDNLNPAFLFIKGDGNPKFSTQDVGELYLIELPFFVLGCLLLFKKKLGFWWLLPFWLLAGIIPAATARETPHALRIETTLPVWQILTAFGMVEFWQWAKKQESIVKNVLRVTCAVLLAIDVALFLHGYWQHYPIEYSSEWQYGYKQTIEFIKNVDSNYDEVWFTDKLGRPYIYFLFYLKKNPQDFLSEATIERDVFGFVNVKSIGKYHFFGSNNQPVFKDRILYIDASENIPSGARIIKTFNLLNNQPILTAYEI